MFLGLKWILMQWVATDRIDLKGLVGSDPYEFRMDAVGGRGLILQH
jgi:hypothetical protein